MLIVCETHVIVKLPLSSDVYAVSILSHSLAQVHGRHVAVPRMVSGAYAQEYGQADEIDSAFQKVQVSCSIYSGTL